MEFIKGISSFEFLQDHAIEALPVISFMFHDLIDDMFIDDG